MAITAIMLVVATGCAGERPPKNEDPGIEVMDASGATEDEAVEMPLNEQYDLASERHRELNDRFAELQAEIFEDEWREGATESEVVPAAAKTLGQLPDPSGKSSYYFSVHRWHPVEGDVAELVERIGMSWEAKGLNVRQETSEISGQIRVVATTPDGFWFSADEEGSELKLTGNSPAYWGAQLDLAVAIAERRDAEDTAGATWDTADLDEDGYSYRIPGVYRPVPAWDAIPE